MDSEKIRTLCHWDSKLRELDFTNLESLTKTLISKNESLWSIVTFLIFIKVVDYFNVRPNKDESIYNENYFGKGDRELLTDLSESTSLTFPRLEMPNTKLKLIGFTVLIWICSWIIFLFKYPEIMFVGIEMMFFNTLLFLFFPALIPILLFPCWMKEKKFKNVETFKDLAEQLFAINLYRYRINEFERLKLELNQYFNKK